MAIVLPLKALVWQDDSGKTWLAELHGADVGASRAVLVRMAETLAAVAKASINRGTEDAS